MARNRRQSESMTSAIGRGCFLLFAGVVCVVFSVIKIIVGSEYVSKCPSREMIPVYIIVSGCLPVLLSALRQPYDSGHEMEKDRWSMKVMSIIAIIGVMVNLAWLVAGTYLVVTVWSGNICNTMPQINANNTSNVTTFIQNQTDWNNASKSNLYQNETDHYNDKTREYINETEQMMLNTKVVSNPADEPNQAFIDESDTNEGENGTYAVVNGDTYNQDEARNTGLTKEIDKGYGNINSSATENLDEQCINCDRHILRFSLAVVIIDWLFVIVGIIYFCNYAYHRFSKIAGQLLLING